jgi:hypothetical protein
MRLSSGWGRFENGACLDRNVKTSSGINSPDKYKPALATPGNRQTAFRQSEQSLKQIIVSTIPQLVHGANSNGGLSAATTP